MRLHIVIPYSRPDLLPIITNYFACYDWVKLYMAKGAPPSGGDVRQQYLIELRKFEIYQNDYIHFLDDDNLIPASVLLHIKETANGNNILAYNQYWNSGWDNKLRLVVKPENMLPSRCDIAQFFTPIKYLNNINWNLERYDNDGLFYMELHQQHADKFEYYTALHVWYNALRPCDNTFLIAE